MRTVSSYRKWKKWFAFLPTQVGVHNGEIIRVWFTFYEYRYGVYNIERRELGSKKVFRGPFFSD